MSLEGRLRELALPEVLQLLGLSRKTGTLHVRAQVQGRAGFVRLANGAVVDGEQWRLDDPDDDIFPSGLASAPNGTRAVEACVLDLLTWRDGDFRFLPAETVPPPSPVRLAVDSLLVEAAQRAEGWSRLEDRVPHAHVVPAFVDVEPQQLPLLRLVPQEWEILTRVDGRRDLTELASVLGRELLDVAEIVHGLIGSGLLTLRESERAPRRHPTPPIGQRATPLENDVGGPERDLWIPHGDDDGLASAEPRDDDTVFDPIEVGVMSAEGLPRRRTTPHGTLVIAGSVMRSPSIRASQSLVAVRDVSSQPIDTAASENGVASMVAETSLQRGEASWPMPGMDVTTLCSHGDDAARRGDLAGALTFWSAALRSEVTIADADRIREAIALSARLHALLHPAAKRA